MKKLIVLLIIAVFFFIFVQSKTLEVRQTVQDKTTLGVHVSRTHNRKYVLHWDRFLQYIKDIPKKLGIQ